MIDKIKYKSALDFAYKLHFEQIRLIGSFARLTADEVKKKSIIYKYIFINVLAQTLN